MNNYLKFALFSVPIFLIVAFLVKEKDLKELQYDNKKIQRGGVYLVIYCITSFLLLFLLAFAFAKN